jgi:TolB protein
MRLLFSLVPLLVFIVVPAWTQTPRDIGAVDIATSARQIPVTVVSADAEMNRLANFAFEAHGAFRRVTTGAHFTVRFTPAGGQQVRVEVMRGNESRLNQTVAGTSARNALLRAADAAVTVMGGGRGFFASRLAFISERTGMPEVYVGDLFFGEVQQLTADHKQAMTPRWSPDGTRLLYTGYFRTGFPDIFQIDLTTMQRTPFVNFKGTNSGARFSPDGQRVAMVLSGEGNPEIYVSNAQGRQIARLTRTAGVEASPVFSPDGARLLFTSDMAGGPQLYLMPSRGGAATRLPTDISRYCAEPDWSTGDPNRIAFTMRIGRGFQIGVYDLAQRQPARQVSRAPMDAVEPSWLADGRHLVYTARSANARSIWLLDTETGHATRLSGQELGMVSQASVLHPR